MSTLTFLGAVGEVTGSRYLIETGDANLLLECGLHQGGAQADRANRASLAKLARQVDAVILSHGHLDHSGLVPKLVRDGYRGPVYCTPGTRDLLQIMWKDAAFVMGKDVEWENKWRRRADKRLLEPLYEEEDVEAALEYCEPLPYHRIETLPGQAKLQFHDAGHILGSAIVELTVPSGGRERRLVFSGDLGNRDSVLMHDPARLEHADVVLLESTYGDRDHRPMAETIEELAGILEQAYADGGNVLIPAFAVGRTQELLYHLSTLHHQGRLHHQKIFLDSPMAIQVTELYARHRAALNSEDLSRLDKAANGRLADYLPPLQFSRSVEDSMAINRIQGGAIIIAGAGMCNGGRIRHHLKYNLWHQNTHVIIVGFQAAGTLGRRLVDGADKVKLLGSEVAVKAEIHTLGGFSAHAGQTQLLAWAAGFRDRPAFHLVHGEPEAQQALAGALKQRHDIEANIPGPGDRIEL
ncbi:MBL fold metallo-hydrolase RNA specificity domain-containing protein [Thioalkalivibrio thiocyanodenitrificans]|uniref:MBL fold metallo-hydrolase RNA specificity domain-containing protein n=1 Tax=Thioalkalivibrio thiocyanodenitrificans TaxID=243063 RepID=UPI00037678B1|nr:MBL fold metallo-hydrolase [Thioalkalivibrio thiocyanodenitrificans]